LQFLILAFSFEYHYFLKALGSSRAMDANESENHAILANLTKIIKREVENSCEHCTKMFAEAYYAAKKEFASGS
jgi:hypothetical protein